MASPSELPDAPILPAASVHSLAAWNLVVFRSALCFALLWSIAVLVHYPYFGCGFSCDDLEHLSAVAKHQQGAISTGEFLFFPHHGHVIAAWRAWFYGHWRCFGLDEWSWRLAITFWHAGAAWLLWLLLQRAFSPWIAFAAAVFWAANCVGYFDNPLLLIGSSHVTLALAFLLSAMVFAERFRDSGSWRPLAAMGVMLCLFALSMASLIGAALAVPAVFYLQRPGESNGPLKSRQFWMAWLAPLLPTVIYQFWIGTQEIGDGGREGLIAVAVRGARIMSGQFSLALAQWAPWPTKSLHLTAEGADWRLAMTGATLLAVTLLARRHIGVLLAFSLIPLPHLALANIARSDINPQELIEAGRLLYLPQLWWCVAIFALVDVVARKLFRERLRFVVPLLLAAFVAFVMGQRELRDLTLDEWHRGIGKMGESLRGARRLLEASNIFGLARTQPLRFPDWTPWEPRMPLSFSELASLIEPSHAWPIEFEPLPARDAAALETATFRIRTAMLSPLEQWLLSIPRGEIGSESVAAIHGSFADFLMQQQRFGPAKNQFLESLRFQRTPQAQRGALLASIHMTKSRQDLTALRNLVQQTPADASAHAILAEAYSVCGDVAASVTELREALRLDGRLMDAGNRLAWILATAPDQEIRNGPEAFSLARQLCQVVKPARAEYFQTFAAALAEVGNFSAAVETEDVAIKIYNSDGHVHEAHQAQARKSQYARGQAFRDLTLTVETRGNFP